jgi:hypothetical protein
VPLPANTLLGIPPSLPLLNPTHHLAPMVPAISTTRPAENSSENLPNISSKWCHIEVDFNKVLSSKPLNSQPSLAFMIYQHKLLHKTKDQCNWLLNQLHITENMTNQLRTIREQHFAKMQQEHEQLYAQNTMVNEKLDTLCNNVPVIIDSKINDVLSVASAQFQGVLNVSKSTIPSIHHTNNTK